MKVAISTDGEYVSAHFGRCPEFTIMNIVDGQAAEREIIQNPGHEPGLIPEFLRKKGVNCIIAGGMGPRAVELFNSSGIERVLGVSGKINDVICRMLDGSLEGGESLCQPGAGKGYGLDKTECDHPENED